MSHYNVTVSSLLLLAVFVVLAGVVPLQPEVVKASIYAGMLAGLLLAGVDRRAPGG